LIALMAMMLAVESRIHRDDLVNKQADAAVAKQADVAVDEQADEAVAGQADAIVDKQADAGVVKEADSTVDEQVDATVDEQADAAVDKQADAAVDNQANAAVDKQANAAEERRRRERGVRLDPDCRLDATLHLPQDRIVSRNHMSVNLHCRGEQSRNPRASIAIPRREGSSANMLGSESDLTIEYSASSEWSSSYDAGHEAEGEGAYWSSDGGDEAPLYWWISFKEKPVEIVTITFEEKYPGALFEFFGSSTEECAEKGTVLISGNKADIYNRQFPNGRSYHCYGLKITKLAESSRYGRLASLTKFDFQYTDSCTSLHDWGLLPCKEGWRYGCMNERCFRQCNAAWLVGGCLTVEWCFVDVACKTHADCTGQQAYLQNCKGTCTYGWLAGP